MEVGTARIATELCSDRLVGFDGAFKLAYEILLRDDLGDAPLDDVHLFVEGREQFLGDAPLESLRNLAPGVPFLLGGPFIEALFPLCDGQLDFGVWPFKVDGKGDQRQSLLLHLGQQFPDLLLLEQQLPRPDRIVVVDRPVFIGADMHPQQPDLTVFHQRVPVLQIGISFSQRLYLRPFQHNARFNRIKDVILMTGFTVGNDDALFLFSHPKNFDIMVL